MLFRSLPENGAIWKNQHPFFDPSVAVVSGASTIQFDVGAGDISKFFVDTIILLHNEDWSSFSSEVKIVSILGNTITVSDDLGFTPSSAYTVELIGFVDDNGPAYRFL